MDIEFYEEGDNFSEEESQIDNSLSEDSKDSHYSEESVSVEDRIHVDILLESIKKKLMLTA